VPQKVILTELRSRRERTGGSRTVIHLRALQRLQEIDKNPVIIEYPPDLTETSGTGITAGRIIKSRVGT
jgi:hypothetical protein